MRTALLTFLLFTTTFLSAQITYNSSDFASVGDSFLVSVVNILNLGGADFTATDTSYTWDFSNLNPNSQRFVTFVSPGSTGFQAPYLLTCTFNCYTPCYDACVNQGGFPALCQGLCTADCGFDCLQSWNNDFSLAELVNDSLNLGIVTITDVFNLYDKTSSRLEQNALGIRISNIPLVVEFQNPDVVYRFPMTYGSASSSAGSYAIKLDSIPGTGINFGFEYKHAQSRTNEVVGWGSLQTPLQVYPDVIKLKSEVINKDSVTIAGNTITLSDFVPNQFLPDTVVEYKWFDKQTGIPVLKATAWRINGNEIYQSVEFIDTLRCFDPFALFGALPIPGSLENSSDSAELNFYSLSFNVDSFAWDFDDPTSLNNTSSAQNPTHYYTEPGVYNVTLTACNTGCPAGWCEDITIPIIVVDNRTEEPDTIADTIPNGLFVLEQDKLDVYPVPFNNELFIQLMDKTAKGYKLTVTDLNGRAVYTDEGQLSNGYLKIELGNFDAGQYFLYLQTGQSTFVRKLVKMD